MLRIFHVSLELIRDVRPLVDAIERRDPDLARQCRRALNSVPLNIAEGSKSQGRNRNARYHNAAGSAREGLACLEVAVAWGHVDAIDPGIRNRFDHVLGTLVRVIG